MDIRPFAPGDEAAISEIYNAYITGTTVTFEEEPLSAAAMRERIDSYRQHFPWLVCVVGGQVVGYVYASRFHARAAYRHTAEVSVYVRQGFERRGIGRALYAPLFAHLRERACHVLLAAIALPHAASVGLHESLGFAQVAHFTEVGKKFGQWIDVGYWQMTL